MRLMYVAGCSFVFVLVVIPLDASDVGNTKLEQLNKNLKNKGDTSTSDVTRNIVDIYQRKNTIKTSLIVYAISNLILFLAQNLNSVLPGPLRTVVSLLSTVSSMLVKNTLDEKYELYQKEMAEAVAMYVEKHRDQYQDVKVGKEIVIKTPEVEIKTKLLKSKLGEPLKKVDKHAMGKSPVTPLVKAMAMNR